MSKILLLVFVSLSVILGVVYRFSQSGDGGSMVSSKLVFMLMASAIAMSVVLGAYHLVMAAIGIYRQSTTYDAAMFFTLFIAAVPVAWVARLLFAASAVLSIHDISSDTANPPVFQYALVVRQASDNSLDYSSEVGRQQQLAYPNIQPLLLSQTAMAALASISHVIEQMGWSLQGSYNENGVTYVEAYDQTAVFGFIDDVVVRVMVVGEGQVQVDMRSASRVGVSDLGANAKRIETFMASLQQQASHKP